MIPPAPAARPTRVLIVDDSALVRRVLTAQLSAKPGIQVVGSAPDPFVARDMILQLKPDVVTLDIEMPRMDGITFLRKVMKYHPLPVIIVSSLAVQGRETAVACLDAGAIDVVAKPNESYSVGDVAERLAEIILGARNIKLQPGTRAAAPLAAVAKPARPVGTAMVETTHKVVAIGASTGGTEALRTVLSSLTPACPGIVIAQHMPEGFTAAFAARLNTICPIEVKEGADGDWVVPGRAIIAPGNRHMKLDRDGARYIVRVVDGPRVNRHRPSVDVLFDSVARTAGKNAFGVIMTGMGNDGARGLLTMRTAGASTIAQNQETCVVYGMPREAVLCGGAETTVALGDIARHVMAFSTRQASKSA